MRVLAAQLVKGATATVASDTISVRIGTTYADSMDVGPLMTGTTNILTTMRNYMQTTMSEFPYNSPILVGTTSTTSPLIMVCVDDLSPATTIFIRRNSAIAATGVVVVTPLTDPFAATGVMRTNARMNDLMLVCLRAGVEAGVKVAQAGYPI